MLVHVAPPSAEGAEATSRTFVELQSEGYAVSWATDGASPCTNANNADVAPRGSAWIAVHVDAAAGTIVASLCFVALQGTFEATSIAAPADDPRRLALATVEALNGLRTRPPPRERPQVRTTEAIEPLPSALFAEPSMVLEAFGGRPLIGAGFGFNAAIQGTLRLQLDGFVPLRSSEARGDQRELSLNAAWARFGPHLALRSAPLLVGASLQAGLAVIWASARTTPPLVGTTDITQAALFSAGAWLECPDASAVYFRASANASHLLPTVELELGNGAAQPFGKLLVDLGIGVGVRWGLAD